MLNPDSLLQSRYRIIRHLGAGGMGAVYEALDERLRRAVALKETFAETDETLRAFEREAHLLANLRHPALPTVSDYFSEGGKKYLVMEFVRGDDLSEMLRAQGKPFAASRVARWADELLDALVYLHGHEPPIIHRDIKPANLKLSASGSVILLDFGLAKGLAGQMPAGTLSRSLLGYSPNYASLEQIQGEKTTPRSDLYSLAATLYHLLTNVKPPDALKRVNALVNDEVDPLEPIGKINPDVPNPLAGVVMQGLAIKPSRRPAGAAELRAALTGVKTLAPKREGDAANSPIGDAAITPPPPSRNNRQILTPVAPAREELPADAGDEQSFLSGIAGRFNNWQSARRAAAARSAERRAEHAAREASREEEKRLKNKTGAARVEEFMREPLPLDALAGTAIQRNAAAAEAATAAAPPPTIAKETTAPTAPGDGVAGEPKASALRVETQRDDRSTPAPSKRAITQPSGATADDAAEVEEMVRDVSVVRTEPVEEESPRPRATDKTAREAKKLERVAAAMSDYKLPPVEFLNAPPPRHEQADEELRNLATRVAEKCKEFNVTGKIEYICPGPVVTTYEFKPDPGVKYSRVTGLVDDLCLALKAESIRIDRVPGKAHVGIEVPNARRDNIMLREVVESRQYQETPSKLPLALGKTIDGLNYVADLARMPHLLIAGATGTGKSVCLNSLVVSILYKARPDEVKFIMIDPKRLELGLYADIPHLATPIITDPKRAANSLKWAVGAMETRYKQLAKWGVRNIDGYNTEVLRRNLVEDFDEEGNPHQLLPYMVIIIDEISELIRVSGEDIEEAVTRLTESGRSAGLHVIIAAQRPNADNVAKAIKETFPCRIAFRVTSKADSREVLNAEGAEHLLAWGDMLFLPPGTSRLVRVHGAYVDEAEIGRIVSHIKAQSAPVYDESITQSEDEAAGGDGAGGERDELFEDALRICVEMKRASTAVIQRRLRIGYGRAAAILDAMEREGLIGQADGARPRPLLGKAFETINHWEELERGAS